MYGMFGGCTTLFHLAVRYPVLVLFLGLGGLAHQVQSPGPGDRAGSEAVLAGMNDGFVAAHPELPEQARTLKANFDKTGFTPTEDQVGQVLRHTDACTDTSVKDVLSDPDKRWEAAWLFYLDTYSRDGPVAADKLFRR